jgi:hypothetical protein
MIVFRFVLIFFLWISASCFSQNIITTKVLDTVSHWTQKNQLGFDVSEIAFSNWNAGGVSTISGVFKGNFSRTYAINFSMNC